MADWGKPYKTFDKDYVKAQLQMFYVLYEKVVLLGILFPVRFMNLGFVIAGIIVSRFEACVLVTFEPVCKSQTNKLLQLTLSKVIVGYLKHGFIVLLWPKRNWSTFQITRAPPFTSAWISP